MKAITARIEILHQQGGLILNTTDWELLEAGLDLPADPEGFKLRHFKVGTEFTVTGEDHQNGTYRVIAINTYVMDEHNAGHENSIDGGYEYGFHVRYTVEEVK